MDINNKVLNSFRFRIAGSFGNFVSNSAANSVWFSVRESVHNSVCMSIGHKLYSYEF